MGVAIFVMMAVVLVVPLMFGLVIVVMVIVASTRSAELPTDPEATVTFQAHVVPASKVFSPGAALATRTYGTLTVSPWEMRFDSDAGEVWATPIGAVLVHGTHGAFSFSGQGVDVEIEGAGGWRIDVSDRRINRFSRNTAKDFRQADAARKLATLLLARGARPSGPGAVPPSG